METNVREYINALSQWVLKEYGKGIMVKNIDEMVENMGGIIRQKGDMGFLGDGSIKKTGDNSFEIRVSPWLSRERRLFTICHELGHLFLHMGFRTNRELWVKQDEVFYRFGRSEQETQANEFAAALIMPEDVYISKVNECTDDKRESVNIDEVADFFGVSISAAINRGKNLGVLA